MQKSELSRLLQVVESVPETVIRSIGAAPKAGRDRWMKLSELLSSESGEAAAEDETAGEAFRNAASDERFQKLFDRLSQPDRPQKPEPTALKGSNGKVFAQLRNDGKTSRLEFSAGLDPRFVAEAVEALVQHYNAFQATQSPNKG